MAVTVSRRPLVPFLASFMVLSQAGCSGTCPAVRHESAASVFDAYGERRMRAQSLRAEAAVEQFAAEGRIRGTVLMFVERPDRVRFDAITEFGPAAILTSDGERFALSDLRENQYLEGPTCPSNIARLLGIPLSGEEVALFLVGDSPKVEAVERAVNCDGGRYLVTLTTESGNRQELEFAIHPSDAEAPPHEQRLRLRRSEVFDGEGETQWRATYDDYRVVANRDQGVAVALPFRLRFEHPGRQADTTVRFRELDLNIEVPPDAFSQDPPPGVSVQPVVCDPPSG